MSILGICRVFMQGITGRYFEDAAYAVNEEKLELFDRGFPPRQKDVTDTQLFK